MQLRLVQRHKRAGNLPLQIAVATWQMDKWRPCLEHCWQQILASSTLIHSWTSSIGIKHVLAADLGFECVDVALSTEETSFSLSRQDPERWLHHVMPNEHLYWSHIADNLWKVNIALFKLKWPLTGNQALTPCQAMRCQSQFAFWFLFMLCALCEGSLLMSFCPCFPV